MDEKRDELLVRKFFEENKIEIPDAGFSRRVMRRLPDRTRRLNRIWTAICVAVGVVMCVNSIGCHRFRRKSRALQTP